MTSTTEMPLLGRCKDCDFVLFLGSSADAIEADGFNDVKGDGRAYRVGNQGFFARCPNRHRFFVLKRIKGTYSPDHKCDARCLNAKGFTCTCSCGGANHGRGHATAHVHTATTESEELVPMASDKQLNFIRALLPERDIPALHTEAGECEMTPDDRRERAREMCDNREFTKAQASKTIEWLLSLPKIN